jgi:hypothetical protein
VRWSPSARRAELAGDLRRGETHRLPQEANGSLQRQQVLQRDDERQLTLSSRPLAGEARRRIRGNPLRPGAHRATALEAGQAQPGRQAEAFLESVSASCGEPSIW